MMPKWILISTLSVTMVCLCSILIGQNSKHSLSLYTGYADGKPDTRYEFLIDQFNSETALMVMRKIEYTTNDDEYAFGFTYRYKPINRLNIGMNLGYAQLVQDFLLPADGNGYFGAKMDPFFWRDVSYYHIIQISPEISLDVLKYKFFSFGINARILSNISFRKEINNFRLSANKTEYFATEFYPGIYVGIGRVRFDVHYREMHWKYRDDAIANNGLNPDTYNPSKWRFLLSYEFWRSKKKE